MILGQIIQDQMREDRIRADQTGFIALKGFRKHKPLTWKGEEKEVRAQCESRLSKKHYTTVIAKIKFRGQRADWQRLLRQRKTKLLAYAKSCGGKGSTMRSVAEISLSLVWNPRQLESCWSTKKQRYEASSIWIQAFTKEKKKVCGVAFPWPTPSAQNDSLSHIAMRFMRFHHDIRRSGMVSPRE